MGVALTEVFDALQAYLGSYYVNDFNRFGRTWQVNVQADAPFRVDAETIRQLKVRNADGDMVPLGAVVNIRESAGPVTITRYNMLPAATITGSWRPSISTGEVLQAMESLAAGSCPIHDLRVDRAELPPEAVEHDRAVPRLASESVRRSYWGPSWFSSCWPGCTRVGRCPAVILVVPMCVLCALAGVAVRGVEDNNIFTQVGFVVLIGLACKNAILIVAFARDRQQEGASRFEAVLEAARERLRPIVMTTMCFIHMAPPYFASGRGRDAPLGRYGHALRFRRDLFGLFLTPVFYSIVRRLTEGKAVSPATRGVWTCCQSGRSRRRRREERKARYPVLDLTSHGGTGRQGS